jgi:hypothetical protein
VKKSEVLVEVLARALWNEERRELESGSDMPSFFQYADGAREPMPWRTQSEDFRRWWLTRARSVLRRVMRSKKHKRARRGA